MSDKPWPNVKLGQRVAMRGYIVDFCEEPNTGLAVIDFGDWRATVPIHALEPEVTPPSTGQEGSDG